MIIGELLWDDENVGHIARHNVTPLEVDEVCFSLHLLEKAGGGRYILSGQSASGRYLNVVVQKIGRGFYRPITAFDMSDSYKARYRKRFNI